MSLVQRAGLTNTERDHRTAWRRVRNLRLSMLPLAAALLAAGAGAAATSAEAATPVLPPGTHLLTAGVAHKGTAARRSTRRVHLRATLRAPALKRKGGTLSWSPVRGISTYVLLEVVVHGKKHHDVSASLVKGTKVEPPAHAGKTVVYRVRARLKGAKWSHRVLVRYPRDKRRPATSGSSGQTTTIAPVAPAVVPVSSDPLAGQTFYVDPNSDAVGAEKQAAAAGQSANAALLAKIASQSEAEWFGDWTSNPQAAVGSWVSAAAAAGADPVIVAYDLPWLDCGGYSAGGASSPAAYETFINGVLAGLAGRRAVVIVEPDALAELTCLSASEQASYYQLLNYAVDTLTTDPLAAVYLDSGNATWQSAATMASRLQQAGIAKARGFSLNVSNFDTTSSEIAYGTAIDQALGNTSHFVIDTSRNGQGPAPGNPWCNPPGRGLGLAPTANTGNSLVDAYLWIKDPGQSDGTCNGGPSAGGWWLSYALGLASNAAS